MPNQSKEPQNSHFSNQDMQVPELELATLKKLLGQVIFDTKFLPDAAVPIIGVDGAAAVGKGTLMKNLRELGYRTFTNGEIFRSLAWCALHAGYTESNLEAFEELLPSIEVSLESHEGKMFLKISCHGKAVLLDPESEDPDKGLRSPEITAIVSKISERPAVMARATEYLQHAIEKASEEGSAFAFEGRDNYQTFDRETLSDDPYPTAMVLLFLAADDSALEQRAIARAESQRKKKGLPSLTEEEIKEVKAKNTARNHYDMTREQGKLLSYEEALEMKARGRYDEVIDTTHMTPDEVFFEVCKLQLYKLLAGSLN